MALLKYDTSAQAWKDNENLLKYDTSANAWTDCEVALKHDGTAWTEVWSGAPDGAVVWKGKNIANVGAWTIYTDKQGIIKNATFNNFEVQSELNSGGSQHRIDSVFRSGDITIPSGATKLILDVDILTERTDLYICNVTFTLALNGSGSYCGYTAKKGSQINTFDFTSYASTKSYLKLCMSFTCVDNTSITPYAVEVVINNLYFE